MNNLNTIISKMPTRLEELNNMLDDIDSKIMAWLPESVYDEVSLLIENKIKLAVEVAKLKK